MKNRTFIILMLLAMLVSFAGSAQATIPASPNPSALVYVELNAPDDLSRFAFTGLPMYALLENGLLSGANQTDQEALSKTGLIFKVVDTDTASASYYLAQTNPGRPAPDYSLFGLVLLTLPDRVLLRMEASQVDALSQAGAELKRISLTPKALPESQGLDVFPEVIVPDPLIDLMIDQVTETQVYTYDRQLAGELPVWVDGGWYTIATRQTYSGTPIQKTTSFVGQHMAELGLDVEYHQWNAVTNPNVIGEIPGLVSPEDIFIIGAHIDDVNGTPGADDNASGSVATLLAADILSQYNWGCTLRFAFWTGEEQGLLGSDAYASRAAGLGENIVGYLNLDMIAYNTVGSARGIDLRYNASMPPTLALAQLFADVVSAYNLNLIPDIGTSLGGGSDHSSFWDQGYTAILAIEDQGDFNPYYHGSGDTPSHTDRPYFTDFVKASLGTFAHMSGCLIPSGLGALDGHVTSGSGGLPLQGASITADDGGGHIFTATTDSSGYYTRTLLAEMYTVTADAYGFQPEVISGVEIVTDTVTTQDFSLTPLPVYTLSGYVREMGSNSPLPGAQIEFLDAPLDPVFTDPTGFYSLVVPQGTLTMRATAAEHAPQTVTVDVISNLQQDFSLSLYCEVLSDDVENGNIGWTAQSPWSITAEASHSPTHSWTDSPGGNYQNNVNTSLTSPVLDLTGYTGITLSYWQIYATESGYDYCSVEYSTNGGSTWTEAASYDGTNLTWTQQEIPLPQLDGQANARVRFHFTADYSITQDGWHIDDIQLIGGGPGCVPQSVAITPLSSNMSGEPGSQVSHVFTVTNLGPDAQDISLSTSPLNPAWTTVVAPTSTGELAAGESVTITATVTVPNEFGPLSDIFTLIASGEVGGYATAQVTTLADANVAVEVTSPPEGSARSGEVVTYAFKVTNTGSYTDSFSLESDGLFPSTLPGGNTTEPLSPGDDINITVLVEIPAGTPSGYMDVTILTATSTLDLQISSNAGVTTTVAYVHTLPFMVR